VIANGRERIPEKFDFVKSGGKKERREVAEGRGKALPPYDPTALQAAWQIRPGLCY
jgi:hypothetical protein